MHFLPRALNPRSTTRFALFVGVLLAAAAAYTTAGASTSTTSPAGELTRDSAAAIQPSERSFTAAALLPAYLHAARAEANPATLAGTALVVPAVPETIEQAEVAAAAAPTPKQALPVQEPQSKIAWGGSFKPGYFYEGQCTRYAAERRGGLRFGGNAREWPVNARAAGVATGKTPFVGAILITTEGPGHAAFVEKVNSDGSFVISEMNYAGWNVVSRRTLKPNAPQIVTFIY